MNIKNYTLENVYIDILGNIYYRYLQDDKEVFKTKERVILSMPSSLRDTLKTLEDSHASSLCRIDYLESVVQDLQLKLQELETTIESIGKNNDLEREIENLYNYIGCNHYVPIDGANLHNVLNSQHNCNSKLALIFGDIYQRISDLKGNL